MRQLLVFLIPCSVTLCQVSGACPSEVHGALLWPLSVAALALQVLLGKRSNWLHFLSLLLMLWAAQALVLLAPLVPHVEVPMARIGEGVEGIHPIREVPTSEALDGFGGSLVEKGGAIRSISVVLPCAEERENAIRTVERFCRRTPSDILKEVLVVDDGSNPPLVELFKQNDLRLDQDPSCVVRFLRHEVTTGLMAAKLTGGREAQGDVIAFIDCHCAPQENWYQEILEQVRLNPRRMVVPAITDLDMDTFDEHKDSQVNAKCYLTFDADFKWFDDESDFIPTISGGLVAMGREWFNLTGGFDEGMHGWGGENLDQSLRAWLCGGEIVRAKSSRIAHMWRTSDRRTATHYRIKARPTNNRGRVVAAWFGPFREVARSAAVDEAAVQNYASFKERLHCRPFSYFIYRFRKLYLEGGVLARESFQLQEVSSGLCLQTQKLGDCGPGRSRLQLGNVDRSTGKCCSGLRIHGSNNCFDYFDKSGIHPYACDVMGRNMNQQYRLLEDGRLQKGDTDCMVAGSGPLEEDRRAGDQGVPGVSPRACQ
ncbi:unnamed protein product [Effrenium voratum]|uniref:Glycosyltransferase 2-like domain-containing protein n=1 Tax=Effrenium voratum TaxID=2562239 RepID=A0AA36IDZ1_9DINO|nr:unnamed protein product [Effrenium voratum]